MLELKDKGTFVTNEDGELVCAHDDAHIEKACCSTPDEGGIYFCDCAGMDYVVCETLLCTGITPWELDDIWERLLS